MDVPARRPKSARRPSHPPYRPMPDLSERLFARHRVEIPVTGQADDVLRLSVAGYTTAEEIDRLLTALARELDAEHGQQDE